MADDEYDDVIHVRCDATLKNDVRVAAAKQGLSMSEYVRQTLRHGADCDACEEQPAD